MFGQKDDSQNQPFQDNNGAMPAPTDNSTPPDGFVNPGFTPPAAPQAAPSNEPAAEDGAPVLADPNPTDFTAPSTPADGPTNEVMDELASEQPEPAVAAPAQPAGAPSADQLLGMKQEALQQLTPLVQHLNQSPEEKFRTVMMMIQASDDHTKLGEAFEAAKQIPDDKSRAQALLDVINEINYFTQHQN